MQQSLSILAMTVGTETVVSVRGKKVLKIVAICSQHLIPVSLSSRCLLEY